MKKKKKKKKNSHTNLLIETEVVLILCSSSVRAFIAVAGCIAAFRRSRPGSSTVDRGRLPRCWRHPQGSAAARAGSNFTFIAFDGRARSLNCSLAVRVGLPKRLPAIFKSLPWAERAFQSSMIGCSSA